MTALSHADARQLVAAAFSEQFQREGTTTELQCLQAIAWLETNYGNSWHGDGVGSFNMGAVQKGGWTGPVFIYTDTHPNADGTSTPYQIGFRKYPNAVAGFQDLCKVVYCAFDTRRQALACASKGDLLGFSTWLHKYPAYFEGFGKDDAERIAHHHAAVVNAIRLQCAALNEPMPESSVPPPPAPPVQLGSAGPAVRAWQTILAKAGFEVAVDGNFGPRTRQLTMSYQSELGLTPDGVVGAATLAAASAKSPTDYTDGTSGNVA